MGTILASGSSPKSVSIPEYGSRLYMHAGAYKIEKLHTLLSVSKQELQLLQLFENKLKYLKFLSNFILL